jgi:Zn-dependent M28 family amino/carboxypeptidase
LIVNKQTYLQAKALRVPEPTNLAKVIAVLRGTTNPHRAYVVSGHYDSMRTSPTHAICYAPGENDDASGTAAVIELARVVSKRKYDANLIVVAVPGEEQGIIGSTYLARMRLIRTLTLKECLQMIL